MDNAAFYIALVHYLSSFQIPYLNWLIALGQFCGENEKVKDVCYTDF